MNYRKTDSGEITASEIERLWKWADQQMQVNKELDKELQAIKSDVRLLNFKSSLWTLVGAMIAGVVLYLKDMFKK